MPSLTSSWGGMFGNDDVAVGMECGEGDGRATRMVLDSPNCTVKVK